MADPMRIVVTGAQGYLGAKVLSRLTAKGVSVIPIGRRRGSGVLVCDLSKPDEVRRALAPVHPDRIVHCAAYVPNTLDEYEDLANAEKSLAMVDHLLNATTCPFVYISSMTVYGSGGCAPKREEEAGDSTSAYGVGKWQAERLIEQTHRPAWAIRIPGLFGAPRLGGLVSNVVRSFRDGEPLCLPDRPLVWAAMHVDDAAESIATLAISESDRFQPVNIAYQGVYSVSRLVRTAAELFGRQSGYVVEHPDFEFDLSRAHGLGAVPRRALRDALGDL